MEIRGNKQTTLTRDDKSKNNKNNNINWWFKIYVKVRKLIENDKLKSESILAYFTEKALRLVPDFSARYELTFECENTDEVFELNRCENVWNKLSAGNWSI